MEAPDYNKMSKKELIDYVKKLINQRAFTYEDRMKLAIIDEAPFTIWANDRDCKIRFWSGKCEKVYGYNKAYVSGKDFVDLFVSKDEGLKARIDCRDIIDNDTPFNNIANDETFDKIPITLQTNCFRIKDVDSAEIGVLTNSIEKEKEKTHKAKEQIQKIEDILKTMVNLKSKIIDKKSTVNPKEKRRLNKLEKKIDSLFNDYKKQEKECNNWDEHIAFVGQMENELNSATSIFNEIIVSPNSISKQDSKQNNGISDDVIDKIQ